MSSTVFVVTSRADHEGEQPVGVAANLDAAKRVAREDFDETYGVPPTHGHRLEDWVSEGDGTWDAGIRTTGWPPSSGYVIREVPVRG